MSSMYEYRIEYVDYQNLSQEELGAIASEVPVDYNLIGIPKELVDAIGGYESPTVTRNRALSSVEEDDPSRIGTKGLVALTLLVTVGIILGHILPSQAISELSVAGGHVKGIGADVLMVGVDIRCEGLFPCSAKLGVSVLSATGAIIAQDSIIVEFLSGGEVHSTIFTLTAPSIVLDSDTINIELSQVD